MKEDLVKPREGSNAIVITSMTLDEGKRLELDKVLFDDPALEIAVNHYAEHVLGANGEEIFTKEKNYIVSESGYYFAFYEEDLISGGPEAQKSE